MRTYGGLTVVLLALFFAPALCQASQLVWQPYDPDTGTVYAGHKTTIVDGGTYTVPFNAIGTARIVIDDPDWVGPYTRGGGELYFIPNPAEPENRELVREIDDFSWDRAGTYEVDIYAYVIAPSAAPKNRFLAWLIQTAHAAPAGERIDTIRFEIHEGPALGPICCSSVVFIPGIQGSVLKEGDNTIWPPSIWSNDIPKLALTSTGDSVYTVVVDGVLEEFYGESIYSGFIDYLNDLTEDSSSGVAGWRALTYDWRFPPAKIIAEGVETPDGNISLIEQIENLASESNTGKVTLVAHSMGGLLGKAIIKELIDRGEENLIDTFVMVGTPQLGTPQGAAALLHGNDQGIPGGGLFSGIIVNPAAARIVAQNMESAFNLMPSTRYFSEVATPVMTFSTTTFTQAWRNQWGPSLNAYDEFKEFVTGTGVPRTNPTTDLAIPEVLDPSIVQNSEDFHSIFDSFEFPSSIKVVQVAGWGLPTVKTIDYRTEHASQNFETLFTREGDGTVVYPTALATDGADESFYFNLFDYNEALNDDAQHRNLLNTDEIQNLIKYVVTGENLGNSSHIFTNKPAISSASDQLLVSTHSPVLLSAKDSQGRVTGIKAGQSSSSGFLKISQEIPGSYFSSFGGDQYLYLPKSSTYSISFKGSGSGPATIETATVSNDSASKVGTYTDIPVNIATTAQFELSASSPQSSVIAVDANGDGQTDSVVTPDNYAPTVQELIDGLRGRIESLDIKPKPKANLLNKIDKIEKKISKQKNNRASVVLTNLGKQILKKGSKGRISDSETNEILALLEQIEQQLLYSL